MIFKKKKIQQVNFLDFKVKLNKKEKSYKYQICSH